MASSYFLLYDAGCEFCNRTSEQVREVSRGSLTARSLRDPEMQVLLDRANRPVRDRDEPLLVRVTEKNVTVYARRRMGMQLVRVLGWRNATRLLALLGADEHGRPETGVNRRTAILRGGVLAAGIVSGSGAVGVSRALAKTHGTSHRLADVSELARLRGSAEVRRSERHLGEVDWTQVHRVDGGFVLGHRGARAPLAAAATAISDDLSVAVSYGLANRRGHLEVEWMTPGGTHLATLRYQADGSLRKADLHAEGLRPMCSAAVSKDDRAYDDPVRRKFLASCMTACMGAYVSGDTAVGCERCVEAMKSGISAGGIAGICTPCILKLGQAGISCMKNCLMGCPPA